MKLGARMIKTGIAVVLALYIGEWFDLQPVIFIVFAAVLATQPSIYRSFKHFLDQIQANVIGAILGYLSVTLVGNDPIVVGFVVIIVIIINLLLKLESSISLSIITVIVVMQGPEDAVNRFLLIFVGIVLSIIVNAAFIPPNHEKNLSVQLKMLNDRILLLLRNRIDGVFDEKSLREEKKWMNQEYKKAEEVLKLYKEERSYFYKLRKNKPYKLVIYRQMLEVLDRELDMIHTFRKGMEHIHDDQIQESIVTLTQYHELILMKFEGRIKTKQKHEKNKRVYKEIEELIQNMLTKYDSSQTPSSPTELITVVSQFSGLAKELERLDTLVTSYNRFHRLQK